ncbi:flagellar hook assembly protein FlgD [Arcobacter arenosus]|uniref:Basal-body rod modification protein FlgD n=1 Tax=Arcobacter arenosus TaxID=2576037 RepID=A0A5R8XYN9_9BACT|nr:flagellar hook capping FlgD N-terminal domain-containing protein [Arcobacter arenosus]TLP35872.1 hypothetical protein FDK22_14565 [Arcobacter arenosus]
MSTAIDGITSTSSTDAYGNTYTTAISGNDALASEDFITLMLTELSMQDPTEPVDSSSMLDDQLALQTLETNITLTESMESLATSFAQSALSDSASLIGNIVETSETDDSGNTVQYRVSSVASTDGTIYLTAYAIEDYYDIYSFTEVDSTSTVTDSESEDATLTVTNSSGNEYEISTYGKTYEELAEELNTIDGINATLSETSDGTYQLVMTVSGGGSSLSSSDVDFGYSLENATSYNSEAETLLYTNVTRIY